MYPYITIFGKQYGTYGLMALCGALAAGTFMCYLARRRGMNDNESIVLMLFSAIGVVAGGSLLYAITNLEQLHTVFASVNIKSFFENLLNLFGGSVFYGGLLGGTIAAILTMKIRRMEIPVYSDMLAVCIPLFHALARVGCFLGGCCYGIESKWGFVAHGNPWVPAINNMSRFPVQLLEAFLNCLLFLLLYLLYRRAKKGSRLTGRLIFVYLLLYAVVRFFDEFLRGDDIRGFVCGLSTSQFISCFLFIMAIVCLTTHLIKQKKTKNAFKKG